MDQRDQDVVDHKSGAAELKNSAEPILGSREEVLCCCHARGCCLPSTKSSVNFDSDLGVKVFCQIHSKTSIGATQHAHQGHESDGDRRFSTSAPKILEVNLTYEEDATQGLDEERKTAKDMIEDLLSPPSGFPELTSVSELRVKRDSLLAASRGGLSKLGTVSDLRLKEVGMYFAHFSLPGERTRHMEMICADTTAEKNRLKLEIAILAKVDCIPPEATRHIQALIMNPTQRMIMMTGGFTDGPRSIKTTTDDEVNAKLMKSVLANNHKMFLPSKTTTDFITAIRVGLKRVFKSDEIDYIKPKKSPEFDTQLWIKRSMRPEIVAYLPFYGEPVDRPFIFTIWNTVFKGKIRTICKRRARPESSFPVT